MVPGQGQYMNGMMTPQGTLSANGMMTGQMAQMGGRIGTDLDNGESHCTALQCAALHCAAMCTAMCCNIHLSCVIVLLPSYRTSFHILPHLPLLPGMFQVNPRGDQGMGGRPVDIRDRVDVRNGKQQVYTVAVAEHTAHVFSSQ